MHLAKNGSNCFFSFSFYSLIMCHIFILSVSLLIHYAIADEYGYVVYRLKFFAAITKKLSLIIFFLREMRHISMYTISFMGFKWCAYGCLQFATASAHLFSMGDGVAKNAEIALSANIASVCREYPKFNTTVISDILNRLTDKSTYDKRLRPKYGAEPVDVGITIHVSSISAVSEVDMVCEFFFVHLIFYFCHES
ncbi:unnamed protein product [Toxocara canis]|uniref:Neur_chan_LBD domain-containing protein n=1 Tax=Toxocara canis TaxID=6265 RepID=A0A183VBF6_TOXCA|nr:unnamed protein product [Toxocara canis]